MDIISYAVRFHFDYYYYYYVMAWEPQVVFRAVATKTQAVATKTHAWKQYGHEWLPPREKEQDKLMATVGGSPFGLKLDFFAQHTREQRAQERVWVW